MSKCVTNYWVPPYWEPKIVSTIKQVDTLKITEYKDGRGLRPQGLFLAAELTNPKTTVTQNFLCGKIFLIIVWGSDLQSGVCQTIQYGKKENTKSLSRKKISFINI